MANLIDMIENPMKEYKFKNGAKKGIRYKYNPSKNRIEYKSNEGWFETDYNLSAFIEDNLEEVIYLTMKVRSIREKNMVVIINMLIIRYYIK